MRVKGIGGRRYGRSHTARIDYSASAVHRSNGKKTFDQPKMLVMEDINIRLIDAKLPASADIFYTRTFTAEPRCPFI